MRFPARVSTPDDDTTADTAADTDALMTAPEVAQMLRLHTGTLERWRREGHGPAWSRLGREVRYRRSEVRRWLISQEGGGEYRRSPAEPSSGR